MGADVPLYEPWAEVAVLFLVALVLAVFLGGILACGDTKLVNLGCELKDGCDRSWFESAAERASLRRYRGRVLETASRFASDRGDPLISARVTCRRPKMIW